MWIRTYVDIIVHVYTDEDVDFRLLLQDRRV